MGVQQISVFLENKKGRLLAVTKCLKENDINIRALSVADTTDFGILRMIVNDPKLCFEALQKEGFTVSSNTVIAVEIPDVPGGLNQVLEILKDSEVNLEYTYAFFSGNADTALHVCRVDNQEAAIEALEKAGIKVLEGDEVYNR